MAIAFDAVGTPSDFNGEASKTWSHTVAGSDRLLLVGVGIQGGAANPTVTFNAVGATLVRTAAQGSAQAWLYELAAPDTGAHDVVVTFAGNVNGGAGSMSFTGVDQTTPTEADNGATGNGGTQTVNVTTLTDQAWVVDSFTNNGGDALTAGAGQTERYDVGNSGAHNGGSTEGPNSVGAVTMSWTSGTNQWAIVAAAVKPAGGGGGTTNPDWAGGGWW